MGEYKYEKKTKHGGSSQKKTAKKLAGIEKKDIARATSPNFCEKARTLFPPRSTATAYEETMIPQKRITRHTSEENTQNIRARKSSTTQT